MNKNRDMIFIVIFSSLIVSTITFKLSRISPVDSRVFSFPIFKLPSIFFFSIP